MINQNNIIADLHTHSIFSLHAYSTIQENISAAQNMNLKFLAITDHIFNDGTELQIKNEGTRLEYLEKEVNAYRQVNQPFVIGGAEFNIAQKINPRNWKKFKNLRWRPIGLHTFNIKIKLLSLKSLLDEFDKSSTSHNAFAHIERELNKVEDKRYGATLHSDVKNFLADVVNIAHSKNIFLELNESSIRNNSDGNLDRINFWLPIAKNLHCRIYLASDSHISSRVGKFPLAIDLLNSIDYPKDLILNCNEDQIKQDLNIND